MTSREEIVLALKYFFDVEAESNVHEIIGQDDDPLGTIATALDEYRKMDIQKSIEQFDVWFEANFSIPPSSVSQQVVRSTMLSAWQASRYALAGIKVKGE